LINILDRLMHIFKNLSTCNDIDIPCIVFFSNFINMFIVTNLRKRPNILKFKQIMSAYQKQNLEKLCRQCYANISIGTG
jgi:hypothetical protein